jgi:HD-like signal output (HDOD) protein
MSESGSLLERINRLIESDKIQLPIFNQVIYQLQRIISSGDHNATEIERLIVRDQVIAADVLRAANSPFYCGLTPIVTIHSAIVRLGAEQVTRLVFLASQRSQYTAREPRLMVMLQELWRHASSTAMAAQWLARRMRSADIQEECFLGGLLHDIGQLLILRVIDEINSAEKGGLVLAPPLVREVLQASHAQLGHNLLRHWNIPDLYCRIALLHHNAEFDPADHPLVIVRLANEASKKLNIGLDSDSSLVLSATPEAQVLKVSDVLLAELEIMLEDNMGAFASSPPQAAEPSFIEQRHVASAARNNW